MTSYAYDDAQYAAEYYALDAEVGAACLALAPQLGGAGVALGDLDELCAALRRPVRDDRERAQLMVRLDPENAMRIDRAAVTTWLLEELFAVAAHQADAEQEAAMAPRVPAVPAWEEIVEPPPSGEAVVSAPSVYYYNAITGETAWALAHPLAASLYRHLLEVAEIRALKAPRDADGFLDIRPENDGELVDDLQRVFAKFDDDRDDKLDANEFRDLCVALSFPLGLAEGGEDALAETMRVVDPRGDRTVSHEALLDFWTAHAPWQRRTRLSPAPFDQWERLERLDKRRLVPWFRHVTTLRERWSPPNADQTVVDLLTSLFPSTKLEWGQRVDMLWELQLQPSRTDAPDGGPVAAHWTLRECRALLDQLGWEHYTRREHVEAFVAQLKRQFGGSTVESGGVLMKDTLAAWVLDCVTRVEMDGWEECVDESSGQRYYYHEVLGLTQWDPPELENRMAKMMARFSGDAGSREEQIKRIFRHYDEDESGSISFREFKRLYVALLGRKEAVSGESDADDARIQQVFSVLDTSGDDEVSLDEFMVWWKTKMNIEDEETEQQRLARVARERRRIALEFLKHHDALITRPVEGASAMEQGEDDEQNEDEDSRRQTYLFESNILARLVAVLGKYPLKGLAYRDALTQLVHATRLVDQEIALEDFLVWYGAFEEREKEKEELAAQKARALALLQAKEAEAKEKARKLKMIRKGQLITKAIASDDVAAGGRAPEPAEVIWKRHVETLFRKFDKDNSGYLDAAELKELTNALGHALDDAQVARMMAIMDSSGDARVSVDEFVTFWTAFQRRKRAAETGSPGKKNKKKEGGDKDEPGHRREAISMVDASANLAVSLELAKERALKMSLGDVKDALGDWKEGLLDRSRKKKLAKELAEQQRARLEALRKEWAAFVPTKKSRYAHLDVTWIEPEVVQCVVDMIETVRARARPLPREDAAQRIQRIVRGVVTRMRLLAMVLKRFPAHVDLETGFFYYVDTEDRDRVWLHRPLFRTITSVEAPWELADCKTKVARLKFRHREREMEAKRRFYHRFIRPSTTTPTVPADDSDRARGSLFVPASFVMFTVLENVRLRMLGNIWHALRDRAFVLAELMARRHWRQLTQRSGSDASMPLPLHHVVKRHRETPFRLIQAIYQGHADAVRARDAYGRTPLHLALRERAGRQVVALLLSRRSRLIDAPTRSNAQPTSVWEMQSMSGETPLHVAVRYGVSLELLRWICAHQSLLSVRDDAAVKIRNQHGHAVLHLVISTLFDGANAAYWRSVVLVLLKTWPRRALCSDANARGDLPLHLAIERYAEVLTQRAMARKSTDDHKDDATDDECSWLWLIRLLIAEFPDALLVRRKHDGLLAIHLLIRARGAPESIVLETLRATISLWASTRPSSSDAAKSRHEEPEEEGIEDGLCELLMLRETKTTLLHYVLLHRSTSAELALALLERIPRACRVRMAPQFELPLHLAARGGAPVAVITRLCEVYGAACQERNAKRELPLHLAVQSATASPETVRALLHYCPFVLSEPSERRGLRALVMAASAANPNAGVLRELLDHTPAQKLVADAKARQVTPLYAISLRKCGGCDVVTKSKILNEMEAKFEEIEDEDAYFTALAKASRRRQHHSPTAHWPIPKILELMEKNPVDEALIQRALLALNDKLTRMIEQQQQPESGIDEPSNQDDAGASGGGLGVVVETVTLNREWMLVRRVHQTMYELPWNARVQLLGQALLAKLLPSAFAKAAYKSRVDPYCNL